MKKAIPMLGVLCCLVLYTSLCSLFMLRNNARPTLVAETVPGYNTSFYININTASAEELTCLPGIGITTAKNIVKYRDQINGFRQISQLKYVPGIGKETYARIEPLLTLGG